jgi:hypothetical protein
MLRILSCHCKKFLGALAKLRRATVSFVMSVCMEQLGSHWTDFREMWHLRVFRNSVERIQVWLKYDRNNGYLCGVLTKFMIISRWIVLRIRNVSGKIRREIQSKYFVFNVFFLIIQFLLWDHLEKYGTAKWVTRGKVMLRRKDAIFMLDNEGNV